MLCDIWNNISIDNHTVKCSYRKPTDEPKEIHPVDHDWLEKHCSISRYCLQISKCDDLSCCGKLRSNIRGIMKERYLPGPRLINRSPESGLQYGWNRGATSQRQEDLNESSPNHDIVSLET